MPLRRHFNRHDLPVDTRLDPAEGWVRMAVTWIASAESCGAERATFGHTVYPPVAQGPSLHAPHTHPNAEEIIYVLRGRGRGRSGDELFDLAEGDVLYVPRGDVHMVENTDPANPLEVFFIYGGASSLHEAGYEPLR